MLTPAFDFKLDYEIKNNLVTLGKCKCSPNHPIDFQHV